MKAKRNIIYNYLFNYLNKEELQGQLKKKKKSINDFYNDIIKECIPLNDELDNFLKKLDNPDFFMTSIKIKNIDTDFIEKLNAFNQIQSLSFGILDIFHFNWKPELSSGQETLLFQFANFYHILKNAENLKQDIIILIDEGETTMHLQWQKQYIDKYIKFLSNNFKNNNFHIVFTTHSPFLLSDIPKENIIFLEDGKNVTNDVKLNTFGANIHTLLSDGFFMDGLMGKFAKSKIDDVIKYLNSSKKLSEEEIQKCEDIVTIIGEPIIKRQLQKMLDSKRLRKMDDIDRKIRDMEYELQVLKKHQSKVIDDEIKDKAKKKYFNEHKNDKN